MIHFVSPKKYKDFEHSSIREVVDYFDRLPEAQVDTETTGFFDFKNSITTLQLGDFDNQFVLDFNNLSKKDKSLVNEAIISNPTKTKIFQNAKFDIKFLWKHGFDVVNVYDTLLGELLLNAGKQTPEGFYSLYSMGIRYCDVELDKEVRGVINSHGLIPRVIEYAANDVKYLSIIKDKQLQDMKYWGLANNDCQDISTVCGLEMNAVLAFAAIEYNGIKLNLDKWDVIREEIDNEQASVIDKINEVVWQEDRLKKYRHIYQDLFSSQKHTSNVNWSSPVQKLNVLKNIFPEIESTAEREMSRYKGKHPIIKTLLEYNKVVKLKSSFGDALPEFINDVTGRIHTDIWQIKSTGRVSFSNPNMQQIPSRTEIGRKMRECFVPEHGYKMVGGDYSGKLIKLIV